jgi:hypothetical protein
MVSDTLDGGQYRNTDLPKMFLIGSGPLTTRKTKRHVRKYIQN